MVNIPKHVSRELHVLFYLTHGKDRTPGAFEFQKNNTFLVHVLSIAWGVLRINIRCGLSNINNELGVLCLYWVIREQVLL